MSDAIDFGDLGENEIVCGTRGQVLMQYTGLKDKNGKEIYEGDIVRGFFQHKDWKEKKEFFTGVVYYDLCGFQVDVKYSNVLNNRFCKDIEAVGNKFENPELLEHRVFDVFI